MNILKQIQSYLIWILISLLGAFAYMRIILGPKPKPTTDFMKIFDWVYGAAMVQVGSVIGIIIAFIYILLDVFYFNRKLKNNPKKIIIRFLIIMFITLIVGTIHYICEKVINII